MSSSIFLYLFCLSLLTIRFGVSREIECIPIERETLLKLKNDLIDPSNRLSSWNLTLNSNCCQWAGVVCNNYTAHVAELHLNTSPLTFDSDETHEKAYESNEALEIAYDFAYEKAFEKVYEAHRRTQFSGEINPCLVDLKHLNYLDLSGNDFRGMSVLSFLGKMTSLTHLNLSYAGFYGKIPSQIGNLSNLLYLDLQSVYLYAENVEWLSSMSKLEYLDLGGLNLSISFNWLNTMQALPSLKHLSLSGCSLPVHYNQPSLLNFSSLLTLDMSSVYYPFIPKWIFGLTKLVSLQLSGNEIQGSIPDGIQNLRLLENLDLSYNSFSSLIPHWFYELHHLKFLNLKWNNLNGAIFDALGNLAYLVQLDLSNNQLEETIPSSLGNLTSLVQLDMSCNQLEGTIQTFLGNLTSLVHLDLSNNQLEGTIPTSVGNLTSLVQLDLSHNQLKGTIPTSLENLTSLVQLDLSHNQLEGIIPISLENLTSLVQLDLSHNQLEGIIPISLGVLCNLREIGVSGGVLPRSFCHLSSLAYLDLSNNRFIGNPFESIRSLSQLFYLSIGDNHFQGVVKDDDLANLTSLKMFYASGNNFTLKVSPNWLPSFQLTLLDMTAWQLGPNFPSWLQSQNNLEILRMSNTGISDSIPTWFWIAISRAFYVNISHNHIHGELSKYLSNPTSVFDFSSNHLHGKLPDISNKVYWLDLSSNYFSKSVTDFLCNKQFEQFELQYLNLASNNLSGKIPDCWMKWPNLIDLNIQSNHFVGNLPPSMGSLAFLESLNIRNNYLSGKFPITLKKNNKLKSLDLGENFLSGTIPTWIGKSLLYMRILRLRSNNFSGHIPNEICDMNFLQNLDLAQNSLSENIPNCFNHFMAMLQKNKSKDLFIYSSASLISADAISILLWLKGRPVVYTSILGLVTNVDLSENNLSGGIPKEITDLDGLIYLNLSNNQLSGQIPSSIGNMRSLESIDISRNQLSGEIPSTISNLSFLNKLDMSYNHLEGKIPTGTQMQSFEASNFVGNNLCGPPLPINCGSSQQVPHTDHIGMQNDGHGVNWLFVSMALGFIVGFWVVVAPLLIYRSWRYAYFLFLEDMWYKLQSCW